MSPRDRSTKGPAERRLRRRVFLTALGLGLAAPFATRLARLASAQAERPKRLFVFYVPHGAPPEHMNPVGSGASFSLEGSGVGVFGPLEPWKQLTTVLRGLEIKDHSNHAAIRAVLTDGGDVSIDFAIARALETRPLVLGALPHRAGGLDADSFLVRDGEWVRPISNPVRAYDETFAGIGGGTGPDPVSDEIAFRNAALGLTEGELDTLARSLRGLTREEDKLARHLAAVRTLRAEIEMPPPSGATCTTRPSIARVDALRGNDDAFFLRDENFGAIAQAQVEIAAQALLCGVTRVATIQNMYVNANVPFGHIGIPEGHHEPISHSLNGPGREKFARCQRWMYEQVARVAQILDVPDPEDPSHTALENSVLVVTSEIADGNGHLSRKAEVWVEGRAYQQFVPTVVIGGGGGALRGGQVIDFENRAHGDALLTIAQAMGAPMTSFGMNGRTPIAEMRA
ncbi:DUF1552 domain-containing protein [Sandaracinus amylolyticus]|uniref:DUF1552 domain-containing protein n=1 Tax=Sandaracinus amylolyticus TaxID=927083 RepID=UPI001F37181F|nr:DUF1552 domain-containing protein [Sandaracinus amylolyticus]UJR81746.1 Hypothetical protein I5071_38060 [Sandaracinus amylolyticus]